MDYENKKVNIDSEDFKKAIDLLYMNLMRQTCIISEPGRFDYAKPLADKESMFNRPYDFTRFLPETSVKPLPLGMGI